MDMIYRMVVVAGLSLVLSGNCFAADPVPLPCHPNCGPIDPCKLAPERCKDKGGPIGSKQETSEVEKSTDTPKIIERELTPDTGEYMRTPCYKTERYCTEWLPDGKCKLWDSRQVPC